jgi:dTDP-4-dehydrorhamnose 3,5-epimerase
VLIELELHQDERGSFARTYCEDEFGQHGLISRFVQSSMSFNPRSGTLRGMHFQVEPGAEAKLVRCTRGSIYDVVIDLRPSSQSYCRWIAAELTGENRRSVYVPEGCAHGFLTLADETEVSYEISARFDPALARGVRWNDPAFGVIWPRLPSVIAERDAHYPDFVAA